MQTDIDDSGERNSLLQILNEYTELQWCSIGQQFEEPTLIYAKALIIVAKRLSLWISHRI